MTRVQGPEVPSCNCITPNDVYVVQSLASFFFVSCTATRQGVLDSGLDYFHVLNVFPAMGIELEGVSRMIRRPLASESMHA